MNDIIAGDPAPTNPTAREQIAVHLWWCIPSSDNDEAKAKANALLDAYRAEVLAGAIKAANAEYEPQDATAERSPYNEGVFDAVSALYRLLNGGAKDRELLSALLDHSAAPRILDIHLDDCEDDACTGCDPQHLAEKAEAKASCDRDCRDGWIRYQARDGEFVELRCTKCNPKGGAR